MSKRLLALLEERDTQRETSSAEKNYLTRLMIKPGGRVVLLKVGGEIDFIEADGNYAKFTSGVRRICCARRCTIWKRVSIRRSLCTFIAR